MPLIIRKYGKRDAQERRNAIFDMIIDNVWEE